ncbi:NAD(P)/FAD-dependent oxidoreductase [Phreatobacter stygius]|uniref:NAD(P)/FAD-dependent oxidoreductase n=1 Tax=Phreatobacter stygius TaxID=1940610 RepID=UPI001C07E41F|nr:NAD(P)/FAD-dependent oxidoreductase [Phreatobacter stygius]
MPYDAVIVGGSFAGLSAAMQLARARRPVLVIDAGQPRNRFASHSHGVLALDGRAGGDILDETRTQLARYPTVSLLTGEVAQIEAWDGGFRVETSDGQRAEGRRLVLATGITDILPDVPGLTPRWGKTVLHCPYCHGYEVGGGPIGVLAAAGPLSVHQASLIADWGEVTLFANGVDFDQAARTVLARRSVAIEPVPVVAIEGAAPVIDGIRLGDGRLVAVKALFVAAPNRMASGLAAALGCAFDQTPLGAIIRTDSSKLTTVPGVYAAGDAARAMANITFAAADGVQAGLGLHHQLIAEEVAA